MQTSTLARPIKPAGVGLLWFTGLAVLLGIMIAYVVLITVPYYGGGIHLMKASEIYEANNTRNLADWYFLLDNEGLVREPDGYGWAKATWVLYIYVGIPLFLVSSWVTATKWNVLSIWNRVLAVAITILFLAMFPIYVDSFNGVVAWLFD